MHLSKKSARSATVSFLSWAPLLRMISDLMGLDGPVMVTSRTVVCPEKKQERGGGRARGGGFQNRLPSGKDSEINKYTASFRVVVSCRT